MFQNSIRDNHNQPRHVLPVLQPGLGFVGLIQLLAIGHIFPNRDVLRAKKDYTVEQTVGCASGFQRGVLCCEHICIRWIGRRSNKCQTWLARDKEMEKGKYQPLAAIHTQQVKNALCFHFLSSLYITDTHIFFLTSKKS
jgi:hypothetical protein